MKDPNFGGSLFKAKIMLEFIDFDCHLNDLDESFPLDGAGSHLEISLQLLTLDIYEWL